MKIDSNVVVNVGFSRVYKKRKFHYNYQFVSHGHELRLRGFSVEHYGIVKEYDKSMGKSWHTLVFMYPGMQKHIMLEKKRWGGVELKEDDLPLDIRHIRTRKEIPMSDDIRTAIKRKVNLKLSDTLSKN